MSGSPSDAEPLALVSWLDLEPAGALESQWLDFKPWQDAESDLRTARDYAASFANTELRELLGLGASPSASVETSRLLTRWSSPGGFLDREPPENRPRYVLRVGEVRAKRGV